MVLAPPKPQTAELLEIQFPPDMPLTDELLLQIEAVNGGLRFERSAEGALVVVSFPGTDSVLAESEILVQLFAWGRVVGGQALTSGAMYRLPDGAVRMPDASWLTQEQWDGLSEAEHRGIMRRCPAFVLEVLSPGQSLKSQQEKMVRWIDCGARLGWLVDQQQSRLWVYRPAQEPQELERPPAISGDPELPELSVDLSRVWR